MRIVSHTCSNTEIVCALGCANFLVGVDEDSDYPVEVVAALPKLGRDLSLDIGAVVALKPDLVLTSLTLPGHEKIVAALEAEGLRTLVCGPHSLADVYSDIRRIAAALNVNERGEQLVCEMQEAMPPISPLYRPRIHVEWWPKPVIVPAKESWVTDVIELAGGINPYAAQAVKSVQVSPELALEMQPDAIVMSWCGVEEKNYRAEVVLRREGWSEVHAIQQKNVVPITEAFLGRPGPRLVEGYCAIRKLVEETIGRDSL
jgi:iron complex transport system substrate-binding protein